MSADKFVDTNILLYSVSRNAYESTKKLMARDILRAKDLGMSAQVLQEFYYQSTHPKRGALTQSEAVEVINAIETIEVIPITRELVLQAIQFAKRYMISYWDGAIVAAANKMGCSILYSEDLNHGQKYGELKVVNPFI